jgi:hypothetical protein
MATTSTWFGGSSSMKREGMADCQSACTRRFWAKEMVARRLARVMPT